MRNYKIILLFFLVSMSNMHSQNKAVNEKASKNSYITFSPLRLLDFHAPRLRGGYIQHLTDHWKIGLDLGLGSGMGLLSQRESENDLLWEIRPEVYYILKPESRTLKYLVAEFFYIGQTKTLLNNMFDREDGILLQYDRADFERQKYGIHLKFGLFLNIGRHWGINFYGGLGFRWTTISFTDVTNARANTIRQRGHGYETIYDAERNDFRPNPTLGAKIYFRL